MGKPTKKVKTTRLCRHRVTIEKTVTLRLQTTVEVEVAIETPARTWPQKDRNSAAVWRATKAKLAEEKAAGIEREWSTQETFFDEDYGPDHFDISDTCIIEEDPHITNIEATASV